MRAARKKVEYATKGNGLCRYSKVRHGTQQHKTWPGQGVQRGAHLDSIVVIWNRET
jgi:hypothetical protein